MKNGTTEQQNKIVNRQKILIMKKNLKSDSN